MFSKYLALLIVIVSLSLWAYPFWLDWYFQSLPTGHGIVDDNYQLLDSGEREFMRENMRNSLKVILAFSYVLFVLTAASLRKPRHRAMKMVSLLSSLSFMIWGSLLINPLDLYGTT